jgi:DNA adenine methylase
MLQTGRAVSRQTDPLVEILYSLPQSLRAEILESAEQYLSTEGEIEQLRFALGLEEGSADRRAADEARSASGAPHRGRRRIAFGWYGGKYSHLNWLLPLLPYTRHYCEPFGGSAAVLVNREPSPVETYNDLDGEVVNFFRVLRDQTDELIKAIGLTPFAFEEFACALNDSSTQLTDLERARRFFVRARQVRTGLAQTASVGRWAHCRLTSRAGMSGAVSRWLGSVEGLPAIAERLLRVQIENRPAIEVIQRFDSEETLFYCDPPYPHETRGDSRAYQFEMSEDEHIELASVLVSVRGKAAISSYRCSLMDELYADWRCVEAPEKNCHSVKRPRREALWMNY